MTNRLRKLNAASASGPKRLSPDARKAQLLKHAMAAFADAGIERAVHADVAARANVSTPTVFKYFPTREALVDAVLSEIEIAFFELVGLKSNGIKVEPQTLTRMLADLISVLCVNRPNLMKVGLIWSVAFSPVRERYKIFENARLDDLQEMVNSPGLTRADARIVFASMFLFVRMHFDDTSAESRQNYIDRLCEMFQVSTN